jgi:hypothetical protein
MRRNTPIGPPSKSRPVVILPSQADVVQNPFHRKKVFTIIKAEVISMKTGFYSISGYALLNKVSIPSCFIELDEYFDAQFAGLVAAFRHTSFLLAHNLCRRMADIDTYAQDISDVLNDPAAKHGEIRVGTLLVGYFSASKALLDAAAISLASLYSLTLTDNKGEERKLSYKQMDFSKREFWKALEKNIRVKRRFERFKTLSSEVVFRRNVAVHRVAPLTAQIASTAQHMEIKMAAKPDADMSDWASRWSNEDWLDPLDSHRKWRPLFLELCKEVCDDIKNMTRVSSSS